MNPTIRIELGDGDYVVAIKPLLHKTARQIREYMSTVDNDIKKANDETLGEIFILNQVTEWSFGPVAASSIGDIPDDKYKKISAEFDQLYKQSPLPGKPESI